MNSATGDETNLLTNWRANANKVRYIPENGIILWISYSDQRTKQKRGNMTGEFSGQE